MKKYEEAKRELSIGVAGGFISGGSLLSYQILLNTWSLIPAIIGAVVVAILLWIIAVKSINRKYNRKTKH
jgi:ATP/ADP translocase